jgi:hypothetical protein
MAQITLNFDDSLVPTISAAFGDNLNLGRDATPSEVKGYLVSAMKNVVQDYQLRQLHNAIQPPPLILVT